jgi:hypothetical protein
MKAAALASIVILSSLSVLVAVSPPAPLNFRVVRFVSPSGIVGNDGSAPSSPWSLSYALTQAGPTNALTLLPGIYPSIQISNPGTKIVSQTKWAARVVGSPGVPGIWTANQVGNVIIDGIEVANSEQKGISLYGSNSAIRNCWVHDSAQDGVYAQRNSSDLIECNLIEHNGNSTDGGSGITLSGTNCVVRGNVLRHNEGWGCQIYDSTAYSSAGCLFYDNLVYGNASGLTVWSPAGQTNYVFNNTILSAANYCLISEYGNLCVTNNILVDGSAGEIIGMADGAKVWSDYNLLSAGISAGGPHDLVNSNPGFVNTGAGLYWLAQGSPARGIAKPTVIPPLDFFGKTETGVTDIGAVQFADALAGDVRVLDPSPTNGADYWAKLSITTISPIVTIPPQNSTVIAGQNATFTVSAVGTPLNFQWTFNGLTVSSSGSSYTRTNCQLSDNAGSIRVTLSNPAGSVVSSAATLTVQPNGKTFYVATNGSSVNNGLSSASPWPLPYALAHAGASNTIILADGGYYTNIDLSTPAIHSGLTIKAQHKWLAYFIGQPAHHVVHTGYGVRNCVIDGLRIVYSYQDDINLGGGGIVQNCWIAGAGRPPGWAANKGSGQGIYVSRFAPTNTAVTIIQYSLIESNGNTVGQDHGIYMSASNSIVRGNVIRYNMAYGCQFTSSYANSIITGERCYNNLIYGNGTGNGGKNCVVINGNEAGGTVVPATNMVYNNILINNGSYPVVASYNGTVCFTNNIVIGGNGSGYSGNIEIVSGVGYADYNLAMSSFAGSHAVDGGHNVVTSLSKLGFVNSSKGLYWLTSGSSARGAAFNRPSTADFFGNAQALDSDIGAFQYNPLYETDSRVLDPSPANPDYWLIK